MKTQIIRVPAESEAAVRTEAQPQAPGNNAAAIRSNLSPEAKSFLGRLSTAQIVAIAAGVPLFGALAYGMSRIDFSGPDDAHAEGGTLKHAWSAPAQPAPAPAQPAALTPENASHHEPSISVIANDDQSFSEAFTEARAELGPGHFFLWKGNLYGTYLKEEWNELSDDTKAAYFDSIPYDKLPDFEQGENLRPVQITPTDEVVDVVIEVPEPAVDPVDVVVIPDSVVVETDPLYEVMSVDPELQERYGILQIELEELRAGLPTEEDIEAGNLTEWQAQWVEYEANMNEWYAGESTLETGEVVRGPQPEAPADIVALYEQIHSREIEMEEIEWSKYVEDTGESTVTTNPEVIDFFSPDVSAETTTDWTADVPQDDV